MDPKIIESLVNDPFALTQTIALGGTVLFGAGAILYNVVAQYIFERDMKRFKQQDDSLETKAYS